MTIAWPWHGPKGQRANTRAAIDLGSSGVKIMRADVGRDRALRVVTAVIEEAADATPAAQTAALQRAMLSAHLPPGSDVRLSIAGQDIMTRLLTLPTMTAQELDSAIRFEGETYIPFPLSEVVIDKQILDTLDGKKMRVLLVAGKRDAIAAHLARVTAHGLVPVLLDVDALAVVNAYVADQDAPAPPMNMALVQFGARSTNVAILQRGQSCCFTRDLTVAGQDLTKAIAEQLGVAPAQAEQLKLRPGEREADVGRAMRHGLEALAGDLRLSLDFYESQFEGGVERIVLTGGSSRIPLVPPFLTEQLNMPVELWAPQRWLTRHGAQVSTEFASRLAVCVGLLSREDL